jgi:hypothetical protein
MCLPEGVPEMVITPATHVALNPVGRPFAPDTPALEIPLAPEVVWVIVVNGVFTHRVGVEEGPETVLLAFTVMVPVAFTAPQPPVNGMV